MTANTAAQNPIFSYLPFTYHLNLTSMRRRNYLKTMMLGTISTGAIIDMACEPKTNSTPAASAPTNPNSALSMRGVTAANTMVRVDMDLYFEAAANLYHKTNNPNGAFPLNVAENKLSWPLLKKKIETIAHEAPVADWVANYTNSVGADSFRAVMASFLSKFLAGCTIDPLHLCMAPGAAGAIELTSWILGEPGDVAVIPAPCYSVYKQDIGNRPGLERYNLITHREVSELKNGLPLTTAHLDAALKDISAQGKRFRMLILTNPDNPTGGIYTKDQLLAFTEWCLAHQVHLVVNEIYGLSLLNTSHPDIKDNYNGDVAFHSFANIVQEKKSDYLHLWYALSKDFGASGFRVGMVYSLNTVFRAAFNNLSPPGMVSNYAQWTFEQVLSDHAFVKQYIQTNQQRLTENFATATRVLKELNVPFAPSRGSLFVWLDLSEFLKENTQDAEHELWMDLYKQAGVLLTPGDGFGHEKRGQFRLVYSYVVKEDLEVAMERVKKYVVGRRA